MNSCYCNCVLLFNETAKLIVLNKLNYNQQLYYNVFDTPFSFCSCPLLNLWPKTKQWKHYEFFRLIFTPTQTIPTKILLDAMSLTTVNCYGSDIKAIYPHYISLYILYVLTILTR